jgi:flagellar basal-body rod protein FlgF
MDSTAYVALSRQIALQRELTTIATNVANATTSGYKAERTLFETWLERAGTPGRIGFVQDRGLVRDQRDGPLQRTDNPLDLAIVGDGYFAVQTPAGDRYTRAGGFRPDAQGNLVNAEGHALLDDAGAPLALPPGSGAVEIASDGTVSTADGILGRIGIVGFADPAALTREGATLYASAAPPAPAPGARLAQGHLEGANVQPVVELARMIETMRAFEGTQRLVETHHELERRAIERVAGTTG